MLRIAPVLVVIRLNTALRLIFMLDGSGTSQGLPGFSNPADKDLLACLRKTLKVAGVTLCLGFSDPKPFTTSQRAL